MASSSSHARPDESSDNSKKRKGSSNTNNHQNAIKRTKMDHRAKQRDARILCTQTSSKAFRNGELDVEKFVKSREFEINAMEDGMSRSKKAMNKRAFQQVPKELRRRTASHNANRVPKRLRARAKREVSTGLCVPLPESERIHAYSDRFGTR